MDHPFKGQLPCLMKMTSAGTDASLATDWLDKITQRQQLNEFMREALCA